MQTDVDGDAESMQTGVSMEMMLMPKAFFQHFLHYRRLICLYAFSIIISMDRLMPNSWIN
jgi:hypothetical protein